MSQEVFKEFYLKKYSGRKLVWQHSLGTCVVRAAFPKGTKELSLSTFQAVGAGLTLMSHCLGWCRPHLHESLFRFGVSSL